MSDKELDIQVGIFNQRPDIQIGMAKKLNDIGIELGGGGYHSNYARIEVRTTEEWNGYTQYVPDANRIIVYSDKSIVDGVPVPGIKIADGKAYVVDLPFVGDDLASEFMNALQEHINDHQIHITEEERQFWNNKINYNVNEQSENLILTRN